MRLYLTIALLLAAPSVAQAQWEDVPRNITAVVRDGAVGCDTYDQIVQYREFREAKVRLMPGDCRQIGGALIDTMIDWKRLEAQGFARAVLAPLPGHDPVTIYILYSDFGIMDRPRR